MRSRGVTVRNASLSTVFAAVGSVFTEESSEASPTLLQVGFNLTTLLHFIYNATKSLGEENMTKFEGRKHLRFPISVNEELNEALDAMSLAIGKPKSKICTDLLTSQIGMMRCVASAVALANSGDIEAAQLAFSNIISDAELQLQNAKKAA